MNFKEVVKNWYDKFKKSFVNQIHGQFPSLSLVEIEDIYQETFLAINDNFNNNRIRENTSWQNYILKIGYNMANKYILCNKKFEYINKGWDNNSENYLPALNNLSDMEEETSFYSDKRVWEILNNEIGNLPVQGEKILKMHYFEKKKMNQIAHDLGYSNSNSVKTRNCYYKKILAEKMSEALKNFE